MSSEDLSRAQLELFRHSLSFVKSMALKCAVDLGIPNTIHLHGGCATLSDVVAGTGIPVSRKAHVRRLMNLHCSPSPVSWLQHRRSPRL